MDQQATNPSVIIKQEKHMSRKANNKKRMKQAKALRKKTRMQSNVASDGCCLSGLDALASRAKSVMLRTTLGRNTSQQPTSRLLQTEQPHITTSTILYSNDHEYYGDDNKLLPTDAFIIFPIERHDVEILNTTPYVRLLSGYVMDKKTTLNNLQRVNLMISGYDNDHRELWQIPEVRTFLYCLNKEFSRWFLILSPATGFLSVLYMCLCKVSPPSEGRNSGYKKWFMQTEEIRSLHATHLEATITHMTELAILDDNPKLLDQIMYSVANQLNLNHQG
jgi:hypothetical protein